MDKLLGTVLRPVNRRGAKLHLIFGGGGSDRMERRKKRVRRVRRRRGGGGDSRRLPQTRPHTPGQDESGDGSLVKRNTAGAKEIRAGLYLTFPTCGLHLGGCVCSIPSLTVRVSQRVSPRVIDLITTSTREELLKEISKDFT